MATITNRPTYVRVYDKNGYQVGEDLVVNSISQDHYCFQQGLLGHGVTLTIEAQPDPLAPHLFDTSDERFIKYSSAAKTFQTIYSRLNESRCHPEKIIQNGKATIVFWDDKTKTVIKRKADDPDDPYAAFGQALMIKMYGTTSQAHKLIDKLRIEQKPKEKKHVRVVRKVEKDQNG